MTAADVEDAMRLKAAVGWNQIEADWRRFLALGGDGCFVAVWQGQVVGSVTTCQFGSIGWVTTLLVEEAHRGAGIGRGLLNRALESLDASGARSVRLDATPLGRPLYESVGFRVDFRLGRYGGIVSRTEIEGEARPGRSADLTRIAALDRVVTGTDRRALLDRFLYDYPLGYLVVGPVVGPIHGFILWRPGSSADQIGPCIAEPDAGLALLDNVGWRLAGRPVIVDVPTDHEEAIAWAEGIGLRQNREFWRMTRGEAVMEDLDRLWASSGPEMG
jgi:GNAT superfamily N-acetyltransferase